jgi:hypothetical protein
MRIVTDQVARGEMVGEYAGVVLRYARGLENGKAQIVQDIMLNYRHGCGLLIRATKSAKPRLTLIPALWRKRAPERLRNDEL